MDERAQKDRVRKTYPAAKDVREKGEKTGKTGGKEVFALKKKGRKRGRSKEGERGKKGLPVSFKAIPKSPVFL